MIRNQIYKVIRVKSLGYTTHLSTPLQVSNILIKQRSKTTTSCHIQSRPFSSKSKSPPCTFETITSSSTSYNVSRTERRALIRKERNQAKRKTKQEENAERIRQRQRQQKSTPVATTTTTTARRNCGRKGGDGRPSSSSVPSSQIMINYTSRLRSRLQNLFILNFTGREFQNDHWVAVLKRLPLFLVLSYCLTDENITPYAVKASLGPSMLPTIQFCGDIWLVETGAWTRAWNALVVRLCGGSNTSNNQQSSDDLTTAGGEALPPSQNNKDINKDASVNFLFSPEYVIGDLLLWEDERTRRISCKRLIGKDGDAVYRHGQYASTVYMHRLDLGIVWPSDAKERGLDSDPNAPKSWDTSCVSAANLVASTDEGQDGAATNDNQTMLDSFPERQIIVPKGCVWLEGDCPLFSVDSRQYGPIPTEQIRGRLLFRLWPWKRTDKLSDDNNAYLSSCRPNRQRPLPYPNVEAYLGPRYGFYRIWKETETQKLDSNE